MLITSQISKKARLKELTNSVLAAKDHLWLNIKIGFLVVYVDTQNSKSNFLTLIWQLMNQ